MDIGAKTAGQLDRARARARARESDVVEAVSRLPTPDGPVAISPATGPGVVPAPDAVVGPGPGPAGYEASAAP